jgi:hypothetical protein
MISPPSPAVLWAVVAFAVIHLSSADRTPGTDFTKLRFGRKLLDKFSSQNFGQNFHLSKTTDIILFDHYGQ